MTVAPPPPLAGCWLASTTAVTLYCSLLTTKNSYRTAIGLFLVFLLVLGILYSVNTETPTSTKRGTPESGKRDGRTDSKRLQTGPRIPMTPRKKAAPSFPDVALEHRVGEFGLLNPTPQDFDTILREYCLRYAQLSSESQRAAFRAEIPRSKFSTLRTFAKRAAVFALRDSDPETLRAGLAALAMLDTRRTDYRGPLTTMAVLYHATERLGLDPVATFEAAAKLATENIAKHLRSFPGRDEHSRSMEKSWGYREVEIDSQIGLASFGFKKYAPEHDLIGLGLGIAGALEADDLYQARSVEIGNELPAIWLGGIDDERVKSILAEAKAGMNVYAEPVDEEARRSQSFRVFTVELDSPAAVQELLEISNQVDRKGTATLGFAQGNVFSLIVARSFVKGTDSIETNETLERFTGSIGIALSKLEE